MTGIPTIAEAARLIAARQLSPVELTRSCLDRVRDLDGDADHLAKVSEGLDGRRIRKEIFVAIGSDIETAKDPNKLTRARIESAFRQALKTQKEMAE